MTAIHQLCESKKGRSLWSFNYYVGALQQWTIYRVLLTLASLK